MDTTKKGPHRGNRFHMTPLPADKLRKIRHVALDMDGTIYRGGTLFEYTNPFLAQLSELGIGCSFLTNNSSKSVDDYVRHLRKLGVQASADQIYTSTQASIEYLREELPDVRRLFVLGTLSMRIEIERAGFVVTADDPRDEPDAVLVGFDTDLNFARLCRAAYWIGRDKRYLASHPDRVCPTDEPTVLVDCGAVCAALREAVGRSPDAVLGKPDPRMLRGLLIRHALLAENLAMVGDRLYTDVEMARRAGALGVLVLSGEATMDDVARQPDLADIVATSVREFGSQLERSRAEGSGIAELAVSREPHE
jgi:HAD superfamily hydrolase (TIGR01450 family)